MIEREGERERPTRSDLYPLSPSPRRPNSLLLILPISLSLSPIPESSFQCRCSFLLARFGMLCDWAGGERKGRWDGGPKEIIFCVRFPPSFSLSFFLSFLMQVSIRPERGREKGIVSPTLEHGEMKWPLLPLFSPSPASLRFNKL